MRRYQVFVVVATGFITFSFDCFKSSKTWLLSGFNKLIAINGFIFVRTILLITDISTVRVAVSQLMPLVIALPVVAVAFAIYVIVLNPMTTRWGLEGLWAAILIFMAARGISQAIWYPQLESKLER